MAPSLDEVCRRLAAVERSCRLTTELALLTDRDLQSEKGKHQIIIHLRGALLDEIKELFTSYCNHKKAGGTKKARVVESEPVADPAAEAAQKAAQSCTAAAQTWKAQFWTWLLKALKVRATAAAEAGRSKLAVDAVQALFSFEGATVLHSTHFHTKEPVDDGNSNQVWRATLDFSFLQHGGEALQAFALDLQAFSYGDLCFHRAHSPPGRAALAAARAAGLPAPGERSDGRDRDRRR